MWWMAPFLRKNLIWKFKRDTRAPLDHDANAEQKMESKKLEQWQSVTKLVSWNYVCLKQKINQRLSDNVTETDV